jgi:hypothetical protein
VVFVVVVVVVSVVVPVVDGGQPPNIRSDPMMSAAAKKDVGESLRIAVLFFVSVLGLNGLDYNTLIVEQLLYYARTV